MASITAKGSINGKQITLVGKTKSDIEKKAKKVAKANGVKSFDFSIVGETKTTTDSN